MSFETLILRNIGNPYIRQLSSQFSVPSPNSYVLPQICQALKISLLRFTQFELQRLSKQVQESKLIKKHLLNEPIVIQLLSSDEEKQFKKQKIEKNKIQIQQKNKIEIKQIEQKTDLSKDHQQQEREQDTQDKKPTFSSIRKTFLIRKQKNSKLGLKLKKQKSTQIEQKLDLTDVALIQNFPFSVEELKKKRESILIRSVHNWDQIDQRRKQRRQIRMLKN